MEQNTIINKEPDGLFSQETLVKIKKLKSSILKIAVWIFIAGVVLAALLLLVGDISNSEAVGKLMGTLFILGLMLIVTVYDFQKIEDGDKPTQAFATLGAVSNVLWALLWTGMIWGVFSFDTSVADSYYYTSGISFSGKMALISSFLSGLGLFGSAVLGIKEYGKRSVIRPLKITSVACLTYEELYLVILTLTDFKMGDLEVIARLGAVAGLAGFVWFVAGIIALVISKREKNAIENAKNRDLIEKGRQAEAASAPAAPAAPKTEEELRAEIEEKVRREMIEKEVRERVEKEMAEKNSAEQK
jgi:hypothetical protein